jgi:hypothetical protein
MRTSTSDRLTRATTEQLLDGGPGPAGLHQLLAAAAGPGTASELAGETAAVAAFADAHRASSPLPSAPSRRPSMLSTAISKILAAKALAAVVLLAGTTGGVALATTVSGTPSPADETAAASTAAPAPSDPEENAGSEPDATASPAPQPSLAGLCKAWSAGATDNPGSAANNPAFGALVEAAGSPEDVPGYCAARAADDEHGRSGTAPGRAAEDQDAPPADKPGADPGQGVPPTAAPGNPDRPAGPPAGRAGQDDDEQGGEEKDKGNSAQSDDSDDKGKGSDDESPAAGRRQNG